MRWSVRHAVVKPFIRITRRPYEEPHHINLVVAASNGRQLGELEIYTNAKDLTVFASGLCEFPKHTEDIVLWELGSEHPEDRFAFYFRIRVVQLAANGLCAVELRFNNNQTPPDREVSEFSIQTLPSDLDRLARLIEQFSSLQHKFLEWNIVDGELREDA